MPAKTCVYLEHLYESLSLASEAAGKKRHASLLLSLLEVKNNVRFDLINKSAMGSLLAEPRELDELLNEGLVLEAAEPMKYAITARGIWHVESAEGHLTERALVEYLDEKYFREIGAVKALSEKERVIVFALVATRSFGSQQPVDLHVDDSVKEQWKAILLQTLHFLTMHGIVKRLQEENLFGKSGNEHPVSNLIRHTDALPRKTRGLYVSHGNQRYSLDVVEDATISTKHLAYLAELVFGSEVSYDVAEDAVRFCRHVAHDECLFIYDVDKNPFIDPVSDELVRAALMAAAGLK